ncbi:MAG: hypothetical protein EOP04_18525 [Proteobacteria bacterium]|nr:MAG: hypothetical protein EOP04_18525 [Pseudomonadota bacterium]
MKSNLLGLVLLKMILLVSIQSCTQYKPQVSQSEKNSDFKSLVLSGCSGQKDTYNIMDGSKMMWKLATINKDGSNGEFIKSSHRVTGRLGTIQGKLNNSAADVLFNLQDLATGDVSRDRIFRDQLFTEHGEESFRLILDSIDTNESSVSAGTSKKLRMVGKLIIGGRIAPLIFNANVSEKNGVYNAVSEPIIVSTRQTNTSYNGFTLNDKIEKLSAALGIPLANTMILDITLILKKDCQ